jgi:hypothetical protein
MLRKIRKIRSPPIRPRYKKLDGLTTYVHVTNVLMWAVTCRFKSKQQHVACLCTFIV